MMRRRIRALPLYRNPTRRLLTLLCQFDPAAGTRRSLSASWLTVADVRDECSVDEREHQEISSIPSMSVALLKASTA
jgi:hypothetical protein